MSKTFRGLERSQIAPKQPRGKKRRKLLPPGARKVDRARKIAEMQRRAERRGIDFDPKLYAMCYGKIKYKDEEDTSRNNTLGKLTVPYKCDYCDYWHVGRLPKDHPEGNPLLWPGKAPKIKGENE